MTLTICSVAPARAKTAPMDGHPWQIRAKQAGLTQRMLAQLVDKPANTISRQLRGEFGEVPGYLVALIVAYERMTPQDRADWLIDVERELKRRGG